MDGNGRWAKRRWLPRAAGHRAGVSVLTPLLETAGRAGVKTLTLYAFSTENWARPEGEVKTLMKLFLDTAREKVPTFLLLCSKPWRRPSISPRAMTASTSTSR
jgi:undecaprenyl diphosphate synthase